MILSATFNHEVQSEVKEDWDQMSESDLHSLALFPPAVNILKLFFSHHTSVLHLLSC